MEKSVIEFEVKEIKHKNLVTLLRAHGNLDCFTYQDLIAKSQEIYNQGYKDLILDIHEVSQIGISGLFALYSVAMLFQGERPANPEEGWAGLYTMSRHLKGNLSSHFKVLRPQEEIKKALIEAGVPVYPDLTTALSGV
jgi:hypothetical protein